MSMLTAKKTSSLGHEYTISRDERELGTLSLKRGRIDARIGLDGVEYRVRTRRFSGVHQLLAADGTVLASTNRVGRSWTLHASGNDFEFRQTAMAGREYTMLGDGDAAAGTISRSGPGNVDASVDLPKLTPELRVFALAVVLLRLRRKRVATAVRGGVLSGG